MEDRFSVLIGVKASSDVACTPLKDYKYMIKLGLARLQRFENKTTLVSESAGIRRYQTVSMPSRISKLEGSKSKRRRRKDAVLFRTSWSLRPSCCRSKFCT